MLAASVTIFRRYLILILKGNECLFATKIHSGFIITRHLKYQQNYSLHALLTHSSYPIQVNFIFDRHFNRDCKYQHLTLYGLLSALFLCSTINTDDKMKHLFAAILKGDSKLITQLLESGGCDINKRHSYGWLPLHAAVINGNLQLIKLLLDSGANVNALEEFSSVPRVSRKLRVSSDVLWRVRDMEFSGKLNHNADVSGFSALHYATLLNSRNIIELLMNYGADATLECHAGHKAYEYTDDRDIASLLQNCEENSLKAKQKQEIEERKKFPLDQRFKQHIIGQEGPILSVSSSIRRKELGWSDEDHPLVFLFIGSSGIGKTELAKQIANYVHKDNKKGFIRLDMSEYQEKHEVAKFIGAPPGYVGYDKGGQLTESLKGCSNAVVLFDEVEKAHPDVLTIMLQLFDEGRLTDGQGNTVECKDAIFVMTSNLASDVIANHALDLRKDVEKVVIERRHSNLEEVEQQITISREFKEKIVQPILKKHLLRDEFLGRINEILYFLPFTRSELNQLVARELEKWKKKAYDRHKIFLKWDKQVLDILADGYDVHYGARSIKYEVERKVINLLAIAHERNLVRPRDEVCLSVGKNEHGEFNIKLQKLEEGIYHDLYVESVAYRISSNII